MARRVCARCRSLDQFRRSPSPFLQGVRYISTSRIARGSLADYDAISYDRVHYKEVMTNYVDEHYGKPFPEFELPQVRARENQGTRAEERVIKARIRPRKWERDDEDPEGRRLGSAYWVRRQGYVPGVLQGGLETDREVPLMLEYDYAQRLCSPSNLDYYHAVWNLQYYSDDGELQTVKVLPRHTKRHALSDVVENVSFVRFIPGKKYRLEIPVIFEGLDRCIGVERDDGWIRRRKTFVPVFWNGDEQIPLCFRVDVTNLRGSQCVMFEDLKLPPKMKLRMRGTNGKKLDEAARMIVSIEVPKKYVKGGPQDTTEE